jgi:hypothetical protein
MLLDKIKDMFLSAREYAEKYNIVEPEELVELSRRKDESFLNFGVKEESYITKTVIPILKEENKYNNDMAHELIKKELVSVPVMFKTGNINVDFIRVYGYFSYNKYLLAFGTN